MQNTLRIHNSKTIEKIAFLGIAIAIIAFTSICMQQAKADTLSVSITPGGPLQMDVSQDVILTATATGGTGPYTGYQWSLNGVPIGGATGSTFDYTTSSAVSVSITVTVTDSSPSTSDPSSAVSIATANAPTVSITPPGPLNLDAAQSQLFMASSSGGSGAISYQWYLGVTPVGSNSNTYSFSQAPGSYSVSCAVTDSADTPVTVASNTVSIIVNSALSSPSASAGASTIEKSLSSTLSITGLSGGTNPYHYQWLSEAPGATSYSLIGGANSDTYAFSTTSSTTSGTWNFEIQVTDSALTPTTVTSSAAGVMVIAGPTATVSPTSCTIDVGQIETFRATPAGGSVSYSSYQWYVDGVAQTGQNAATFSYFATSPGSPSITATVTDSAGATSSQSSAPSVRVNTAPTVSLSPFGPLTVDAGQSILCTASPSGGSGTIHYHWYIYHWYVGATTIDSDYNKYAFSEPTGSYSVTCTVTDSADVAVNSSASNSVSIIVNDALSTPTADASAVTVNRGQGSTLIATGLSGGTAPYRYQWLSETPGASSYSTVSGATSSTYAFSTTGSTAFGTWHFELQATDSAGTQTTVTSPAATIEVCPIISFATNAAMTGDAQGTVLSIDTLPYAYNDLQALQFTTWTISSTHTITATSKVSATGGLKQYVFQNWTSGNGLVTATGTFTTPSADTTVIANYAPQYQIAVATPSNGQITPNATAFYDAGSSQTFSINPSSGYHITDVIIDGSSAGTNSSFTFNSISISHTISAAFAPNSPSPSPTPQPTPSASPSPTTTTTPTATPMPALSPTPHPTTPSTTTPISQQTPIPTLTPAQSPTSTATTNTTQPPTNPPTTAITETPSASPTATASASSLIQNLSSAPTAVATTTSPQQIDSSTSGILTGEMAAMLVFIVAILIVVVLVFKKGKR